MKKHDLQIKWLCFLTLICLGFATWTQAAYIKCKVVDIDKEKSQITVECPVEGIEDIQVGDTIKGKKVTERKVYEGC
jgi:hypothetical protein